MQDAARIACADARCTGARANERVRTGKLVQSVSQVYLSHVIHPRIGAAPATVSTLIATVVAARSMTMIIEEPRVIGFTALVPAFGLDDIIRVFDNSKR